MGQKIIIAICLLAFTACNDTSSSNYELDEELRQKALEFKQARLEKAKSENVDNPESGENQENSPKWLLRQVFKAARTGDFSELSQLCDPVGEIDRKTRRLCEVEETADDAKADFQKYFETGVIAGEATIKEDSATVPIKFGYDRTAEATINFIKRDGKWYMSSFD